MPDRNLRYHGAVPLAAKDNLDELYALQRLLQDEVTRLQLQYDACDAGGDKGRAYIIDIEIAALQEESTVLGARISDILERDLQR